MRIYKTIDLFAGIGGIRKGFEQTGHFKTVFANDFEPNCKITYDKNFSETKMTVKDIRHVSVEDDGIPDFDFLLSGFPCQPFSLGGLKQGLQDRKGRGVLFREIIRIIEESEKKYGHLPAGFLLENVKNLKTHDHGNTYKIISDALGELGYHICSKVINSLDFGVAQNRERIYIVGFRDAEVAKKFEWPDPIIKDATSYTHVRDILDTNVAPKYYYEDKPLYGKISQYITETDKVYSYRRTYVRSMKGGYSPTLVASMGQGGHNVPIILDEKGIRRLTPMECARLQGYEDLRIPVELADAHVYKQIGNSVTVPVIRALAENIVRALDN